MRYAAVLITLSLAPLVDCLPSRAQEAQADRSDSAAAEHPACRPSPETEALLADLDLIVIPDCSGSPDCVRARIEKSRRLVSEQPDNVHLQRNLQDLVRWYRGKDRPEVSELLSAFYARRAEDRPDDPVAQYLHGRILEGEEQRRAYRRALEADPDFPWGHLGLAAGLAREDRDRALEHLRHYLRLCPENTVEALLVSRFLPVAEVWEPRLEILHRKLRQESLRRQLWGFPRLWMLEFQIVPPPDHASARERVREEVEILRRHDRPDLSAWWSGLKQGYESGGDAEALARFGERLTEARPCDRNAVDLRMERLGTRFPPPPPGEEPDPKNTREAMTVARRWLAQCPDNYSYSSLHYHTAFALGTLSDEEILAEIERHLAVWEQHESGYRMFQTPWGDAAERLLEHGLDPGKAVALAEKEVARAERERQERLGEVKQKAAEGSELSSFWIGALQSAHIRVAAHNTLLARARFAAEDAEGARQALEAAETALVELRALETTYPEELYPPQHDYRAGKLLEARAEQAKREGRTADAFALSRRAARLLPSKESKDRVRELWTKLGGTDEGWEALSRRDELKVAGEVGGDNEDRTPWQPLDEPLPKFELSDLEGKTWTPEVLAGKTVLINLWATWCGPCRLELPYVQELHQRLADRPDMEVVTLNADYNSGLIQPFVDEHGYRFPVVLAEAFLIERYGGLELPQSWIVDSEGRVRLRQRGFSPELGETWVEEALGRLESVASSSKSSR